MSDPRQDGQQGEKAEVGDVPAVNRVYVPLESLADIQAQLDFEIAKYGHFFKTRDDAEYFAMLPLQQDQKQRILKRALEIERDRQLTVHD